MSSKNCYHFTYLNRAFSINQTGLEPRNGENSKGIQDSKVKVFFSEGEDGAIGLFANFYSVYKSIKSGERTTKIDPTIAEKVRKSKDFEEYLGKGMYLTFDGTHIVNEKNKYDGVTGDGVPKEDINVCLVRNNKTGEFSYSKFDFIRYLMSSMSQEQLQSMPPHIQNCVLEYKKDYEAQIRAFEQGDYSVVLISLEKFCQMYKSDIIADINQYRLTDDFVRDMLSGKEDNFLLREGLCGQDLSNWDLSNLSPEMFRYLCFDSRTKFSKEQEEKFHPQEILALAKQPGQMLSQLHRQGITGRGIKIAVIDAKISEDEEHVLDGVNVASVEDKKAGREEQHGITVLSALKQTAPEADITYFPYDKTSPEKDTILREHIMSAIEQGIKIISMSTSFNNPRVADDVKMICQQQGITLIDSETFYKDFSYCFREVDQTGNEICREAFCEPETVGISEEHWKKYIELFKQYGIDVKDVQGLIKTLEANGEKNKGKIVTRLSEFSDALSLSTYPEVRQAFKSRLMEDEKKQRKENRSVEVPCGGKTFVCGGKTETGEDNYKYWASCSASYTIPQVAAMFVLARQVDSQISYRKFTELSKTTSIKENGRMIISPNDLIEQIRTRNMEEQQH